ncbi:NahK/ErcS family hybrid sensor histidine kinase/response regulator [Amphritea sp.]|uniref:PAS domain-containing hybrid sensor histidine kinase/response regulator n=1 Tax=Amphritea sp. TaxID=1872502 RepID=UPI003A91F980
MKKRSEVSYSPSDRLTVERLMGLGGQSARKSHYPELVAKIEELEAERNRYKLIFEHAQHGIFQARLNEGLITANPALARICGYTDPDQLCNRVDSFAGDLLFDADEYPLFLGKLQLHGKLFGYETQLKRQDGSAVDVSLNVLLKQDDRGDLLEAFVADITERRKAQNKLKKLNEELEQRVDDRTEELVAVNDKLLSEISERNVIEQALKVARDAAEQANKSKDKYLAAASHDLLQPLNAARLLVSTLQERELAQDNNHLVERIHIALEGAEELLSDLLDISRLDQNAVQPDLISIPVDYLFRMLQVEFQPVAEQREIQLKVCGNRLNVQSDTRLLMRVLRNFLSNAFRYTPEGKVLLGARRRADRLEIQVWDTGPGIPDDRLDDIFREFQQIDHQYQTGRKGVGLGLAIVERIAGMLDHPIGVRSQLGQGTMFSVSVPISGEVVEPILQPQQLPQHDLSGRAILVIDNENDILVSMKALLEQWNCQVYVAIDANEAIDSYLSEGLMPELILADFHLNHDTTGVAAVAQVREFAGAAIPAAMITADRSPEGRKLFRAHGLPVLNKPVKAGKLRALVSHLLQQGGNVDG